MSVSIFKPGNHKRIKKKPRRHIHPSIPYALMAVVLVEMVLGVYTGFFLHQAENSLIHLAVGTLVREFV